MNRTIRLWTELESDTRKKTASLLKPQMTFYLFP